jgi:twitching motility protein PilT
MDRLEHIFRTAATAGASDVHLKPGRPPVLRVDGELRELDAGIISSEWLDSLLKATVPGHLQTALARGEELDFSLEVTGAGRFRVAAYLQRGRRALVARAVKSHPPAFDTLGLPPSIRTFATFTRGLVLFCGATGAGKSTTMAALLQEINLRRNCHIVTIEDPIEYLFDDAAATVDQREIGIDTAEFEHALRAVLRQDPDVIMIGELRDRLSLDTALRAADTGHLVFSTLHTTTAAQSIRRMLDFYPADQHPQLQRRLADSLCAVACQRMVKRKGGGVIPACEILRNTPVVKKLIQEGSLAKLQDAIEAGEPDGMLSFNASLLQLIQENIISQEEALAHASNPQTLRMNLQGIYVREGSRILDA